MAEPRDLDAWTAALTAALGLESRVDVAGVLDLARVAAHTVARPAAPLTTYIAGLAAANGIDLDRVAELVEQLAPEGPS